MAQVYPPHVGENVNWARQPLMHLTETSTFNTTHRRDMLYAEVDHPSIHLPAS